MTPQHVFVVYRDQLDRQEDVDLIWVPYTDEVVDPLNPMCTQGRHIWAAEVPLLCFNIAEWHYPSRVMRQYNCRQPIPPPPRATHRDLHSKTRKKPKVNWAMELAVYITLWDDRADHLVGGEELDDTSDGVTPEYLAWYDSITRRFIQPRKSWDETLSYRPASQDLNFGIQGFIRSGRAAAQIFAMDIPSPARRIAHDLFHASYNDLRSVNREATLGVDPSVVQFHDGPTNVCSMPGNDTQGPSQVTQLEEVHDAGLRRSARPKKTVRRKDSKGIPHILEHSVLCGSRKYPLKEPFVELLKGSLHTFLNAFTYPDRTCYPVASTNTKDFYNLVDVYLDAVFFPKCVQDEKTFQQEGWHYELNDPSEEICYKGVVFNEMKGVYSQPDNILGRAAQQALFPDNTYGVDSGGDPKVIPKLTFKEFKEFHRKFYHPSNARIWFYGDDDPKERLRILSEYLDVFEASPAPLESKVAAQKLFSGPLRVVEKYPAGEGDLKKKNMVCLNWLLSDKPLDLETELAIGFLDHLLLGTPASPLRKTLLESGLGEAIIGGGVEDELLQPQFSIGLKGVAQEDIGKVEELVMTTLKKLAEEGFHPDTVEASMNTIEFSLRENNTGSFPRGLSLMLRSIGKWIYDLDPFEPLKYEEPLNNLKAKIAKEGSKAVFSPLIEEFILNNPHLVTVEMQPDPEKASADEAEEKEILEKVKASMTKEDLSELARATQGLRLKQETPDPPEALKCVPSLSLDNIPKTPTQVPLEVGEINDVKILKHDLFTNDVLYADAIFNMSAVKQELLPLVPLFCQSLMEMGTKDLDFVQLNQLIGRKTGGISVYPFTSSIRGKDEPCSHMIVRGKAMAGHADDLFNLMNTLLQEVQFTDQQRFKQFVSQSKARMENRIRGSGHGVAAARMDSKLNTAGWVSEQMGGLSYLEYLRSIEEKVDQDWDSISSSLDEIRKSFLSRRGCLINLTADGKNLMNSEKFVGKFLDSLPNESSVAPTVWNANLSPENEAIVVPTQVNYVGKAANIYSTGYELKGSAYVISKHISNTWLWDRVRVSGGAYGGFCDFDTHSGVFTFLSYRDPNLLKTLDVYDGTTEFLRQLEMDSDTLTKAIIGTIGDVDSYQLPDAKGYSSLMRFLLGITEEERQKRREEILSTSVSDFKEFGDAIEAVKDRGVVVAVASPDDVEAANKERPNFFKVKRAL